MTTDLQQQTVPQRHEVSPEDCWDISSLYPHRDEWKQDLDTFKLTTDGSSVWPELQANYYQMEQPESLESLLKQLLSIERKLDKLYTYAHLVHDQDITNPESISDLKSIIYLYTLFKEETSWIQPALISLPKETIAKHLSAPCLSSYRFYLEKIFRLSTHTGTPGEERILASAFAPLEVANKAFSSLSDSEIPFGNATDSEGNSHPLSHALASLYMQSQDRELRKTTYFAQCERYHKYRHTFATLLDGQIKSHLFYAKGRKYNSCLEASLYQNNIPTTVYTNLIEETKQHSSLINKYYSLKQKILNLKDFHFYDVYTPINQSEEKKYSYQEAVDLICASLSPLGAKYVDILRKGLTTQGWVDKYENLNKRSGAYSSGCYDSHPYILLNYTGTLYDVSVIAHEGGHSMHSYFSRKHQLFHNAQYPIFLAEIASTLNEMLLMDSLLKNSRSNQEKITIISRCLDTIFATLFRQVLFAAFEYEIHSAAERGIPLTEEFFSSTYSNLQQEFYGNVITFDTLSHMEWARIPHFYYNFYVYQYATGIIAALCFLEKILANEENALTSYLNFLESGGSDFPLEILKKSGLDMTTKAPLRLAFNFIDKKIHELSHLI
ncbi:Oligoendopeptidase F, plasmid [Chlamydia avium]|uniref:Oligopeptidase F n=1 Tax=Chlamydia avium TaxID=1457141 RepID=A0ABP2X5L3_9CHLA|nr:oligoendopeptidase F [Chlamydia avium]EPP37351.1 oligoendopeptidase F [Chlamydia psittaci 10_743_SC13]EPP38104.1 oligoendopeptidase F [Chlamydia avium]VVT42882.1 Oligoendopeptidase F, plasmid [Chlamydia avium]